MQRREVGSRGSCIRDFIFVLLAFGVGGMALWKKGWVDSWKDISGAFSNERSLELKKIMCALPPQLLLLQRMVLLEVMQFIYDYYKCE
jgi:hypothetical protein